MRNTDADIDHAIELSTILSTFQDEEARNREEMESVTYVGKPIFGYSFHEDTSKINDPEILELIKKYRSALKVILGKGISITLLKIHLRYAKFYIQTDPAPLRKMVEALVKYAAGEPFDLNDILRFIEMNLVYYNYFHNKRKESLLASGKASRAQKGREYDIIAREIVYHRLYKYLITHDFDRDVKEVYFDFLEADKLANMHWHESDSLKKAYREWKKKADRIVLGYLKNTGINMKMSDIEKPTCSTHIELARKLSGNDVLPDIIEKALFGNILRAEKILGHKLPEDQDQLLLDCKALEQSLNQALPATPRKRTARKGRSAAGKRGAADGKARQETGSAS